MTKSAPKLTLPPEDLPTPEPWEQQPGESNKAYGAFVQYRDMPPLQRSIRGLARQLDKTVTHIGRWSSDNKWTERCARYDRWLAAIAVDEAESAKREMVRRHADIGLAMVRRAAQALIGDEANGVTALDLSKLKAVDIARLIDVGVKVERLSRGAPDSVTELTGPGGGPLETVIHPSVLSRRILENPEARLLACKALEAIARPPTDDPDPGPPGTAVDT